MREDGRFEMLTKKERLGLDREYEKLMKNLAGIKDMGGMPDMMFIIDVRKEDIAIKEANRLDIPIVAVVDTNCSPEGIDHVIPGNDDALRAIRLFASRIADAIIEGRQVGTEGRSAEVEVEDAGEGALPPVEDAPIVESRISIPKEFLSEDEVAEIESPEIEDVVEDDEEVAAAEVDIPTENTADLPVAETALEAAEVIVPDAEDGSAAEVTTEESSEAKAS
jgi:small subunit ribosomal protein S2